MRTMNWKAAGLVIAVGGAASFMPMELAAQRCRGCTPEDTTPHLRISPALGLHFGAPQKASAAVGVLVGEDWQSGARDHSRNAAIVVEPGVSAGRASIAYVDHGYGSFGSGFGVAGTVLRTWNDPWWTRENATYAGGEVFLWPIVFIGPRLGLFRSIAGNTSPNKWFVSLDFGIGL